MYCQLTFSLIISLSTAINKICTCLRSNIFSCSSYQINHLVNIKNLRIRATPYPQLILLYPGISFSDTRINITGVSSSWELFVSCYLFIFWIVLVSGPALSCVLQTTSRAEDQNQVGHMKGKHLPALLLLWSHCNQSLTTWCLNLGSLYSIYLNFSECPVCKGWCFRKFGKSSINSSSFFYSIFFVLPLYVHWYFQKCPQVSTIL